MNSSVETAGAAYLAPKIMRRFKLRWLLYGAAAYYGLRFMSRRGIFPKQTNAMLNAIDRGVDAVKARVGMGGSQASEQANLTH